MHRKLFTDHLYERARQPAGPVQHSKHQQICFQLVHLFRYEIPSWLTLLLRIKKHPRLKAHAPLNGVLMYAPLTSLKVESSRYRMRVENMQYLFCLQ